MTVASYLDLQNACVRELNNRTDLSTEIKAAIQSAISHYQKQTFWFSEEIDTATTVADQPSIAVPTNFGFVDGLTIVFTPNTLPTRLTKQTWATMLDFAANSTVYTGLPSDFAIYADQIWFYPTPNGAYALTLYQNIQNSAPVNDSDTSSWTDVAQAEELIRSRAIADVRSHVLRQQAALQEMAALGELPYFSKREMVTHKNLMTYSALRMSTNRIRPAT